MVTLIYFILILGVIVLVHEFGHFIFAKIFGIYVYEFSIGMGPKIFGKKRKNKNDETEYCIRAIPIGGFVSMAGEEVDDDTSVPKDKKMYSKKPWQRFLVMFFGAGNNFIFAGIILLAIALIWGAPNMDAVLSGVDTSYPAYEAGLRKGDIVTELNNYKISSSDDLAIYMQIIDKTKPIEFEVLRNGKTYEYKVQAKEEKTDDGTTYMIGVTMGSDKVEHGILSSINYMFRKTGSLFKQMFITIKGLFTGGISVSQMSGPVGIYSIVGSQRQAGFENILYLVALLSINVGVINLLPLPAFDGGRILFLAIEKLKGSPVNAKTENIIHSVGFILLMALMIYITFNDILRLF